MMELPASEDPRAPISRLLELRASRVENGVMSSDLPIGGALTPALVFDTLFAYQRTAALRAAIEIDLFRAVGEGPGDVASLARRCSASERGTRILCDFLTIAGLLKKT